MIEREIEAIATEALAALDNGRQVVSFAARYSDFTLDYANQTTAMIRRLREARGEKVIGRKIGFTNRTIWAEYGVFAPIWGYVYQHTCKNLADIDERFALKSLLQPRIEPEIVFGLARLPEPGMDEAQLLQCVDWIALGFELVQSIFPEWRFAAPDTVAAFGLHGALLIGPRHKVTNADWLGTLASFEIDLKCNGAVRDHGHAENVLGGPLSALKHLVGVLAQDPVNPPVAAGELVTTGTLTRALPIAPGESWATTLRGVALEPLHVRFE